MRQRFTLIELLMVVAVIAILVSLLYPSFRESRKLVKRVVCGSGLKQIGMAVGSWSMSHKGLLPPGANSGGGWAENDSYWTWHNYLNDQLNLGMTQQELDYSGSNFRAGYAGITSTREAQLRNVMKVFKCASDQQPRANNTIGASYSPNCGDRMVWLASSGANGTMNYIGRGEAPWFHISRVTKAGNTLLIGERTDTPYFPIKWASSGAADNLTRYNPGSPNVPALHKRGYLQWVQVDGSLIYAYFRDLTRRQAANQ